MNTFTQVPPGFRFHPTDEELVDYYLRRKIASRRIDIDVIKDVDLYRIEPWDLQELCRIGTEEQNEWYFFSHKDKKYPTGTRTNRATTAGFWKATGRDKAIYSKHDLIGMRKTLVFYKGRAPNGQKSDWIMHEYRLETDENATPQEEGWVVCRVFKKRIATMRKVGEHDSPIWYDDHQVSFMADVDSPKQHQHPNNNNNNSILPYNTFSYTPSCKKEMDQLQYGGIIPPPDHFLQHLPLLESPKLLHPQTTHQLTMPSTYTSLNLTNLQSLSCTDHINLHHTVLDPSFQSISGDHVTDWRVLDKFVASQLSQENNEEESPFQDKQQHQQASDAPGSCSNDLWK